jgi:hypothetical protein
MNYKVYTPMDPDLTLKKAKVCDTNFPYRQIVGSLMHCMVAVRPDISFAVGVLARFANGYDESHYNAAKRVLMYLNTTKRKGLCYERNETVSINAFADADFAAEEESARSTTGMVIRIGNVAVSWKSKLQSCVTLSSAEAEIVAATETAVNMMSISNLLNELGIKSEKSMILYEDNNACIAIATKPNRKARIRHMAAKFMYIQELCMKKILVIEKVGTEDQAADMLTKAVSKLKTKKFSDMIGLKGDSIGRSVDSGL